jgi:hypothetical protein
VEGDNVFDTETLVEPIDVYEPILGEPEKLANSVFEPIVAEDDTEGELD